MVLQCAENPKIAKTFSSCQPVNTEQADMGQYFLQYIQPPFHRPHMKTYLQLEKSHYLAVTMF